MKNQNALEDKCDEQIVSIEVEPNQSTAEEIVVESSVNTVDLEPDYYELEAEPDYVNKTLTSNDDQFSDWFVGSKQSTADTRLQTNDYAIDVQSVKVKSSTIENGFLAQDSKHIEETNTGCFIKKHSISNVVVLTVGAIIL